MIISIKNTEVPAIGLGTWLLSGKECIETVRLALSIGYRHIDTAQIYGNENEIGAAIRDSGMGRDELFLVTKVATSNFRYGNVIRSTLDSLDKLKTDYVDLLLLHWPDSRVPLEESVGAMNRLVEDSRVRRTGLSNFPPSMVEHALGYGDIFCNQIEYHPYLSQDEPVAHAGRNGYLITAYCPLAKGQVADDKAIRGIGMKYDRTPAQVTLRWLYQQGVCAIPKSSSEKHLRENMDIFGFELTKEDMDIISSLDKGLHLDPVSHMSG